MTILLFLKDVQLFYEKELSVDYIDKTLKF